MKSIEGLWEGTGFDIALLEGGMTEKTPLKLFLEIKKVEGNIYIGKTQYFFIDGPLQVEEPGFLILRDCESFTSEDPSGSGINYYDFEQGFNLFGLNKLTYKYNINGKSEFGNLTGEFVLFRSHRCQRC